MWDDLSYLAGLFDGEGSVGFHSAGTRKSSRFVMQVNMTDEPTIDWLFKNFGGYKTDYPSQNHHKDQWRWKVQNEEAALLYIRLKPYLRIKNTVPLWEIYARYPLLPLQHQRMPLTESVRKTTKP